MTQTQMNFSKGGVKASQNVATCGQAEKGEAKRPLHCYTGEKGKGHTVRSGPMVNFKGA